MVCMQSEGDPSLYPFWQAVTHIREGATACDACLAEASRQTRRGQLRDMALAHHPVSRPGFDFDALRREQHDAFQRLYDAIEKTRREANRRRKRVLSSRLCELKAAVERLQVAKWRLDLEFAKWQSESTRVIPLGQRFDPRAAGEVRQAIEMVQRCLRIP